MKNTLKILFLSTFLVTSCGVQKKDLQIVDGSKADGTVTLAVDYDAYRRISINLENAKQKAVEKCKAWGYNNAELFDAGLTQSIGRGFNRVTYKAQCTN